MPGFRMIYMTPSIGRITRTDSYSFTYCTRASEVCAGLLRPSCIQRLLVSSRCSLVEEDTGRAIRALPSRICIDVGGDAGRCSTTVRSTNVTDNVYIGVTGGL